MGTKYIRLNKRLYRYLCRCRSDASDPLLQELRAETAALGEEVSKCQISDDQGTFLSVLVAAAGVKSAIEVGTFTGYSSLCIARALPARWAAHLRGRERGMDGRGAEVLGEGRRARPDRAAAGPGHSHTATA